MTTGPAERALVDGIVSGLDSLPPGALWPEFDPATTPLAIGLPAAPATWLLNHDAAEGYADQSLVGEQGSPRRLRRPGIDERLVANGVAMIGDRPTATIIADGAATVADLTALAAHECFHVFQAARYPTWGANEASLLTYPWDDPDNLAMANLEGKLLVRARHPADDGTCSGLTSQALATRRRRSARLPADCRDYENAVELTEGTARYIEHQVATRLGTRLPEPDDAGGIDVRRRCYRTGRDWCLLLDRLAGPDWPARLATGPDEPMPVLIDLLAAVIATPGGTDGTVSIRPSEKSPPLLSSAAGTPASLPTAPRGGRGHVPGSRGDPANRCDMSDDEAWHAGLAPAIEEIAAERARRADRLDALRRSHDGTIVIRGSTAAPLWVTGFDPMNLTTLPGGTVIHGRYLALTLGATQITVRGRATVTTAAGEHPLFGGIARADVPVDGPLIGDDRAPSRADLAALGVRITGPFTLRRTGPLTVEIVPVEPPADAGP